MNLQKHLHAFIQFHFKLFDLLRIYTNLYKYILILFENKHSAALLHTAALPGSRTLPHCHTLPHPLPDSCTLLQALPRALPHTSVRTAAHCRTPGQPHTAAHTAALLHTATRTAAHCRTAAHSTSHTARHTLLHAHSN
jgi:hypothetical protein